MHSLREELQILNNKYFLAGNYIVDSNKQIVLCPKYPIMPFEELFAKLNLDNLTNDKVTELSLLMILGGYWNKKQAVNDLLNFLQSDIRTVDVFDSLFQKYLVTD